MSSNLPRPCLLVATLALATCWATNLQAVTYDEGVNGDLSGDTALPTSLGTLGIGSHAVAATFGSGDFDLLTFTIGSGHQLSSIVLNSFGGSALSFTGLQSGAVWTAGLGGAVDPTNLLGWTHISTAVVGTDILDDIGLGAGAIGFSPPLSAGSYTLELQDTGPTVTASINLNVVPEPSSLALATMGAVALATLTQRHRRRARRTA